MKSQINIRASELLQRQLSELTDKLGTSITETVSLAIDRMYQQEIQTMNTKTIITIKSGSYTLEQLSKAVADASQRGEWYNGENSTNISDWLAEGEYTSNETIKNLAAEWDNE